VLPLEEKKAPAAQKQAVSLQPFRGKKKRNRDFFLSPASRKRGGKETERGDARGRGTRSRSLATRERGKRRRRKERYCVSRAGRVGGKTKKLRTSQRDHFIFLKEGQRSEESWCTQRIREKKKSKVFRPKREGDRREKGTPEEITALDEAADRKERGDHFGRALEANAPLPQSIKG